MGVLRTETETLLLSPWPNRKESFSVSLPPPPEPDSPKRILAARSYIR